MTNLLPWLIGVGFVIGLVGARVPFNGLLILIIVGAICYLLLIAFHLVMLPVEFNASWRAKSRLQNTGIIRTPSEVRGTNRVLNAAALTYVISFVAMLGNFAYLMTLTGGRSEQS